MSQMGWFESVHPVDWLQVETQMPVVDGVILCAVVDIRHLLTPPTRCDVATKTTLYRTDAIHSNDKRGA